jgi:hypothetical protein
MIPVNEQDECGWTRPYAPSRNFSSQGSLYKKTLSVIFFSVIASRRCSSCGAAISGKPWKFCKKGDYFVAKSAPRNDTGY